ncbi:MAG: hypothetical protein NNA22_11330, partial [Nitrospira sp.]|nr:hypothetical protein [Nitrospira sp.]
LMVFFYSVAPYNLSRPSRNCWDLAALFVLAAPRAASSSAEGQKESGDSAIEMPDLEPGRSRRCA